MVGDINAKYVDHKNGNIYSLFSQFLTTRHIQSL